MRTRLALLAHASTPAARGAAFGADEGLDPMGVAAVAKVAADRLRRADRVLASPARAALETAAALGLSATLDAALSDLDAGRWAGRAVADLAASEPEALAAWTRDADAAPHGGQSLTALQQRVRAWMAGQLQLAGHTLAIAHPMLVRAAVTVALEAPPLAVFQVDVAPLGCAVLVGDGRRWTLRALGGVDEA